jgi:RecA-family ATPase
VTNEIGKKFFQMKIKNQEKVVPSSYMNIGHHLLKGYRAGYVYCFNAMTGIGKSWVLLNEAINIATNLKKNMYRQHKVLFVSTEMDQIKTLERVYKIYYDVVNVMDAGPKLLADDNKGINVLENFGFFYAERGMTTDILYEQIADEDGKSRFDLVVIDYLDDFEPTKNTEIEYKRHRIISEDFTELAVKLNVPILTATQGNRKDSNEDGSVKKNRGYSGVGDGYQKLHKMAAVWNLIKLSDEVSNSYRGCISMKNRDVANAPDCHFDLIPSGRLIEVDSPPDVFQRTSKSQKKKSKAAEVDIL